MKTREEIFNILKQEFPEDVLELLNQPTEPIIVASPGAIHNICFYLRDTEGLQFDSLMVLSGVDDANGEKQTEEDGSVTINGGTLSVYYHLESLSLTQKVTLKVSTPRDNPEVESVESVWKSANWHEREAYDMFGIKFLHHPDLRRILMPYDWDAGYPLRKDYKNPEFYQGMKVPY
ncbi:MAG: NADH-quinone oxidoreductase subunit C [Ignavibacteria bacterium]|jgi:NADH-quinone oxidoreductase subunit C|nr:NADH-quinone oxidoreductase subunit C [Ignavibacteria bacterium]MCU7501778.1 NADH-quinone oxidoreductase subunit C [Ignavibacteria bacterium]MCU7516815.1 NADH-quinone oxidoreductase subunit C [Ignavibacteria bacterium]